MACWLHRSHCFPETRSCSCRWNDSWWQNREQRDKMPEDKWSKHQPFEGDVWSKCCSWVGYNQWTSHPSYNEVNQLIQLKKCFGNQLGRKLIGFDIHMVCSRLDKTQTASHYVYCRANKVYLLQYAEHLYSLYTLLYEMTKSHLNLTMPGKI